MHYSAAFQRPFQDMKKFAVGWLLFMVPFVSLVTSLFAYGYILNCAKTAMKKQFKLPEWKDWEDLFVQGLLISIIGLLYFLPAIVMSICFGLAALWLILTGETSLAVGIGLVASGLLGILTIYIVPCGILNYAKENHFKKAFAVCTVLKSSFTIKYFKAWIISILYAAVISLPAGLLVVAWLPSLIGPFVIMSTVSFVLSVTSVTLIGEAFGEI
jgi:hypothetical protein